MTLESNVLTKSYTTSVLLTPGSTYAFKVEARNSVGLSLPSSSVSILCASPPSTPAAPQTSNLGDNIVVTWTAPSPNGSTITAYQVVFKHSDGVTYSTELTNCNGSQAAIVSALSCSVPSITFTGTPFGLAWGSSISAQVIATNIKGSSPVSPSGNGAIILKVPDAPVSLANNAAITSSS
jgi:hypothetical protein